MATPKQATAEQQAKKQAEVDAVLKAVELIPEEEKGSLLKALDRCPDVFEGWECDVTRFLRYTGNEIIVCGLLLFCVI
jgi:hypothetical protein